MKKDRNWGKRVMAAGLCALLMLGLCACGRGNEWIFSLNGEKLFSREVEVFGLIYVKEYNIADTGQMKELYDDGETYEEYYKRGLEDEIISAVLLYREAKREKHSLTREQEAEAKDRTQELINGINGEWLKKRGISEEDIEKIYQMKLLGDSYIEGFSKGDSGEAGDRETERYVKVYQVAFSTVELDENGLLKSDEDGNPVRLTDVQIKQKKIQAEEFAKKAASGGSLETLLKNYDGNASGMERYLKYNDLEENYKRVVDSLSRDEVSGAFEGAYGYYVIQLMGGDAQEYEETVASYEERAAAQDRKDEILEKLYRSYVGENENYRNEELWDEISVLDYIRWEMTPTSIGGE